MEKIKKERENILKKEKRYLWFQRLFEGFNISRRRLNAMDRYRFYAFLFVDFICHALSLFFSRALGWVFLDQSPSKVTSYFASSQAQQSFRTGPWLSASAFESWHIFRTKFGSSIYHVSGVSNIVALEKNKRKSMCTYVPKIVLIQDRFTSWLKWNKLLSRCYWIDIFQLFFD